MKKIISLFQRNYAGDYLVRDEVVPGAEWVLAGDGVATQKLDGTCCLIIARQLYKRFDLKRGKTAPAGFSPAQDPDPTTGNQPGWLLVGDGPQDEWHREAFQRWLDSGLPLQDGTYELVGPKVQGNPEKQENHGLVYHGGVGLLLDPPPPRDFAGIKAYLAERDIEGIVWHRYEDREMVKIKTKDFGLKRGGL